MLSHSPQSGLENGSPGRPDFYHSQELKYHGRTNRGVTAINFLQVAGPDNPGLRIRTISYKSGSLSFKTILLFILLLLFFLKLKNNISNQFVIYFRLQDQTDGNITIIQLIHPISSIYVDNLEKNIIHKQRKGSGSGTLG